MTKGLHVHLDGLMDGGYRAEGTTECTSLICALDQQQAAEYRRAADRNQALARILAPLLVRS